jgi:hypothetical protein
MSLVWQGQQAVREKYVARAVFYLRKFRGPGFSSNATRMQPETTVHFRRGDLRKGALERKAAQ